MNSRLINKQLHFKWYSNLRYYSLHFPLLLTIASREIIFENKLGNLCCFTSAIFVTKIMFPGLPKNSFFSSQSNPLMVITVIGLHGAHVLLRVVLAQDTVHAVVPTLLRRLLVNLVITWEVMKTLRHASKVTVQVRSINFNLSLSFFHPSSFQFLILFLQFSHLVFKLPSTFALPISVLLVLT